MLRITERYDCYVAMKLIGPNVKKNIVCGIKWRWADWCNEKGYVGYLYA